MVGPPGRVIAQSLHLGSLQVLTEALRVWHPGTGLRAATAGQGPVHPVLPALGPMGSCPAPGRTLLTPLQAETTAMSHASTVTSTTLFLRPQPRDVLLLPFTLFCLLPPSGLWWQEGHSEGKGKSRLGNQLPSSGGPPSLASAVKRPRLGLWCRVGGPAAWSKPKTPAL